MHRGARVVRLFLVAVVALVAYGILASAVVRETRLVDLDRRVAEWIAVEMPGWAEWLARPFTWLGGSVGVAITVVALVAWLLAARRVWDAAWVVVALVGIQLLTAVTKQGYDRPRPDAGSAIELPSSTSFPSGHASGAVVTAGVVAALAWDVWPGRRRWIAVAAALAVLAIGGSRIVLGVHYVSDVAAGYAFGVAWLSTWLAVRAAAGRRARPA